MAGTVQFRQSQYFDDLSIGIHCCGVGRQPIQFFLTWLPEHTGFSWNDFFHCGGSYLFPRKTAAPSEDEFFPFQISINIICLVFHLNFFPSFLRVSWICSGWLLATLFSNFYFIFQCFNFAHGSFFIFFFANCTHTGLGYFLLMSFWPILYSALIFRTSTHFYTHFMDENVSDALC